MTQNDFDSLLMEVGEFGPYQIYHVVMMTIVACGINPWNGFQLAFLTYTPSYKCNIQDEVLSGNITGDIVFTSDQCHYSILASQNATNDTSVLANQLQHEYLNKCTSGWIYDQSLLKSSIITEWDLICDQAIQTAVIRNVLFTFPVIGLLVISSIQDRKGRKPALCFCAITVVFGCFLSSFMPNAIAFTIARAFAEFANYSTYNTAYVWATEFVGPSKRTQTSTALCGLYAVGAGLLPVVAYLCQTWRILCFFVSGCFALILSSWWICLESPRWLYTTGRRKEAVAILEKMKAFDSRVTGPKSKASIGDAVARLLEEHQGSDGTEPKATTKQTATFWTLLTTPNLRAKTLLLTVVYIANNFIYIMIAYCLDQIGGNFLINFSLQALVEAPAVAINLFILNRYGRILPLCGFMLLTGFCNVATAMFHGPSVSWAVTMLAVMGKFFVCIASAITIQVAIETFPTSLRASGLAIATIGGALTNTLSPYIYYMSTYYDKFPFVFTGLISILAGIMSIMLPETKGRHLPDTVEDALMTNPAHLKTAVKNIKSVFG